MSMVMGGGRPQQSVTRRMEMIDLASDLDYPGPKKMATEHVDEGRGRPLCIFHSPCLDGFTAAWAMWLKYPDTEFVPGVYGQDPPDCAGRDVYLLDFSYKRAVMKKLALEARRIVVLDHHKSAEAELAGLDTMHDAKANVYIYFDMNKAGARLAWEWFHPYMPPPLLVRLVEDHDLWRFAYPDARVMNAAFFSYDYDFHTWNWLCDEVQGDGYSAIYNGGAAILRKQDKDIRELVGKLKHDRLFYKTVTYPVPCANLPYTLASDAANLMAEGVPFAATYYQDADGDFVFSLRSREGGADVSEVAARYGGGGHKQAAGFRVESLEDL
jgi:hypothetical protein